MTPEAAVVRTCQAVAQMEKLYGRPVFDEWALIVLFGQRGGMLGYEGPRRAEFVRQLATDLTPLRAELANRPRDPGGFGFTRETDGGSIDAYIVAGPSVYLLFNHTSLAVREITADLCWRKAQAPFVELAEMFRLDPVTPPAQPVAAAAAPAR